MDESAWIAISAIASGAVAVATGFLALYTHDLAKETRESLALSKSAIQDERVARRAEDLRHMDGFMPHIALEPRSEILELAGRGLKTRFLALYATNIGAGFACNVQVSQGNVPNVPRIFVYDPPTALGAGDRVILAAKEWSDNVAFMGYKMSYEDAFGREFESRIADNIVVGSRYSWTRPSSGSS